MKIVDFDTFCKMPAGTIFAPFTPMVLEEELAIKVDGGEPLRYGKYWEHYFNGVMPLEPWLGDSCSLWGVGYQEDAKFEIYDGSSLDYWAYEMFLVFEEKDIDTMIGILNWAKNGCKGEWK